MVVSVKVKHNLDKAEIDTNINHWYRFCGYYYYFMKQIFYYNYCGLSGQCDGFKVIQMNKVKLLAKLTTITYFAEDYFINGMTEGS